MSQKNETLYSLYYYLHLCQVLTDFKNSFTGSLCGKFANKLIVKDFTTLQACRYTTLLNISNSHWVQSWQRQMMRAHWEERYVAVVDELLLSCRTAVVRIIFSLLGLSWFEETPAEDLTELKRSVMQDSAVQNSRWMIFIFVWFADKNLFTLKVKRLKLCI